MISEIVILVFWNVSFLVFAFYRPSGTKLAKGKTQNVRKSWFIFDFCFLLFARQVEPSESYTPPGFFHTYFTEPFFFFSKVARFFRVDLLTWVTNFTFEKRILSENVTFLGSNFSAVNFDSKYCKVRTG